jgi:crossover junction endodeoxyribonuclease RuvC
MDGHKLSYVASGTIRTTTLALGDLPGRLKILFDGITEVAARYEPDVASVEIVFVNVNPQSTLLLGQARGAALVALTSSGLGVSEYTALQMKKAVVGHGLAAKAQIQAMVQRLLQLPGLPGPDAADALGLADGTGTRSLSDEFAALQDNDEVDAEIAAMKARLGKTEG